MPFRIAAVGKISDKYGARGGYKYVVNRCDVRGRACDSGCAQLS